ncbi:putative periplasmic binding protein [Dinoroseobacter shibae DFL 12 = DSM 16493]|jgi:spermidine/putrescine transport system substrate-binding protein|uniref:Putative periplasmic binding protein n=1 Tax=Dinoroseobacter shibae (strain DSM 16493 / NCIMB 14021 / DFL 12) TaxID=398580 RepID=A8LRN0_DINSH|nr:ABC transporter substrate-binding protein [Dinoroseobacter shibae]ABV94061.1 putative periplasmic binding protein [Dinoroseobacter shibae DFL 12 = DSM 16493]URF45502.1 extracellular solute-binding protein [Dinoroseobacter shibae]URF49807.1 extracellular solute-binding protein [Dinoroseobacter shibae]
MSTAFRLTATTALAVLATPISAADGDLIVFDYAGFELPEFHSAYVDAHGASPEFTFFGDEEEAFQKMVSGFRPDVSHVCAGSVTKWVASGLLEPWDTSRIPAFADLNADLTGQDVTEGTGNTYFIPLDFGSTGIAYNMDEVPAEDVASLDVFRNPKYAQRITLPDNVDDAYALAYLATGTTDWTTATDAQFEAASAWLREVHSNLRTYWTDPAELAQLLAMGEVLVAWAWNETLPTMTEEGFPIGYQQEAAEGSSLWLCGYVNLAEGQGSEDKAYDFMNAMLDPSSTRPLLEAGYGHSNAAAMAQISAEELASVGLGEVNAPVLAQLPMSKELREKQSATFERIKAGF